MNRLASETSPYLRQHADNPVDWFAWGEDAFAAARERDRPILLSVGYSSCHWCHVMAHESFEDDEVAGEMNRLFVNVKVDREERPDVDAIYMQAVQAMTGRGGWPMTVFLAPDGRPFHGGTYYPKDDRHGMPGFVRVMHAIDEAWTTRRDELLDAAGKLHDAIARTTTLGGGSDSDGASLTPEILDRAWKNISTQFDARFGGFGRAPKFPQAMTLDVLARRMVRDRSPELRETLTVTLDGMAAGGMYDHVGGGFHRYSVDDYWLVPHFEKMLYDQALLVGAYLRGFLVTGEPRYRRTVEETIEYVLRDLAAADGRAWCSAEDADSEGIEGKFYLWSLDEVRALCGDDAPEVIRFFGVTDKGNFVDPHTEYSGNILHAVDRTEDRPAEVERVIPRLREIRAERVRPGLDDKVLLAWNALFLRALVESAAALERDDWMDAARTNARFLFSELRRDDGRLLRSWQDGRANLLGYAEDYAALLEALLTLAELDDVAWLAEARAVADEMVRLFHDEERGGFFTTGADAETLIVRPKDMQDNATPSENSLACNALLRLAALTGELRYEDLAASWLRGMANLVGEHPTAFAYLLGAIERFVLPPVEVAVIGDSTSLWREVTSRLLPATVVLRASEGSDGSPLLTDKTLVDGEPAAYVCEHYACQKPVTTAGELRAGLDAAVTRA
ncbi:MAG: thioredoxin domain-containing protein [Actinobacteria bacterium]|nr:thioredoxin domain-containing protein [Actinomycetota bacterium]